ncbi:hypothetical protein RI367_001326 [Sorochytrium milnesiophthora]
MSSYADIKSQVEARSTVRVLSYNFYCRPPLVQEPRGGDYKEARLQLLIDTVLPQYDIIILQEMFTSFSSRATRLLAAAKSQGFHFHVLGPQANRLRGRLVDSGIVILSRWPVSQQDMVEYTDATTVDRIASKGVTYSCHVNEAKNVCTHLFTTHMQASYSTAPAFGDATTLARATQLKQIAQLADTKLSLISDGAVGSDGQPVRHLALVCGDLNINSMQEGRQEYDQMLEILSFGGKYQVTDLLGPNPGISQVPWVYLSNKRNEYGPDLEKREGSRLDYIISITRKPEAAPAASAAAVSEGPAGRVYTIDRQQALDVVNARVEPFRVDGQEFMQLSDHWGVHMELNLERTEKL